MRAGIPNYRRTSSPRRSILTWVLALITARALLGWGAVRAPAARPGRPAAGPAAVRSPAFSAALAANTLDFFVSFAALLFIAQYLQVDATTGLAVLVTGSVVFSLGSAPMTTLATDLMVGNAPPERAGAARDTFRARR
jgi:hypothetical protein